MAGNTPAVLMYMSNLIIIGGGAAACTAGMFAGRRGLATSIIAKDLGGQTASTSEIENYPGVGRVEGPSLMEYFARQARDAGCIFLFDEATKLSQDGDRFVVHSRAVSHTADAIILAFGKTPKSIGIRGEEKFIGKGLHYCNSYDVEQYRDKTVAVVGGGNSALGLVWKLSSIARRIYLIHRRNEFHAERILLERLALIERCEKRTSSIVEDIHGGERLDAITLRNILEDSTEHIAVDGMFVAIGFESHSEFVKDFVELDSNQRVVIDQGCTTTREGVFAAGDCTTVPFQQIVISAGEGAKAAISAYQYISKKNGKRPLLVDWGFT